MQLITLYKFTLTDLICNVFYKLRFWYYRKYNQAQFCNESPDRKEGWEKVFEDQFDQKSWSRSEKDERKWSICEPWGYFHPREYHYWIEPGLQYGLAIFNTRSNPRTFFIKDNKQYLTAPDGYDRICTQKYQTSGITTAKVSNHRWGRWEFRCQIPIAKGVRSALWLSSSKTWPPEIDILEVDGLEGLQKINLHYGVHTDSHPSTGAWKVNTINPDKLQEFAMEWGPDKIEMFVDGVKIYRFTNKKVLAYLNDEIAYMNTKVYQAVIKPEANECTMFLDYVKIYQKRNL